MGQLFGLDLYNGANGYKICTCARKGKSYALWHHFKDCTKKSPFHTFANK